MMTGSSSRFGQGFGTPYTPAGGYRTDSRSTQGNMFGMEDSMLARVEALAAVADIKSHHHQPPAHQQTFKTDLYSAHDMGYMNNKPQFTFSGETMLEHMNNVPASHMSSAQFGPSLTQLSSISMATSDQQSTSYPMYSAHSSAMSMLPQVGHHQIMHNVQDVDCDPRELESFAERFKQRRIKLGVTQADVGKALGNLKLPGVGSLSQSTICRFESLTLSHNNMIALKPVLQAWLEDAELAARDKHNTLDLLNQSLDKKRKRTSIAAPEKRSLEAYFAIQPRPSGEKIAQIADKLELKKNVVRVWFCNQRQKQKRMKFAANGQSH